MSSLQLLPNIFSLAANTTELAKQARILGFDARLVQEVVFHGGTVLILFYVLAKLLFNPVREILTKRKEGIAKEYSEIESAKQENSALKDEYEEKLANINQEATEILENARKLALKQENKIIKEAKQEAKKIKDVAYLEIEREKAAAKDDIRKEIIQVATMMTSKFVKSSIDESTRTSLLEETLNEMGEQTWLN